MLRFGILHTNYIIDNILVGKCLTKVHVLYSAYITMINEFKLIVRVNNKQKMKGELESEQQTEKTNYFGHIWYDAEYRE